MPEAWQTIDGFEKLSKQQLLQRLRSQQPGGAGSGQDSKPPPPPPKGQQRQYQQKDWSHRKAEWVCRACGMHNFVTRMDCRKCAQSWAKDCAFIAAGTPPPNASAAAPASMPGAPPPLPTSVKAAEQALWAAQQANAPEAVISQWQAEIAKRKETEEASKAVPSLRARLATATAEANAAMQAREKAQKQAELAKAQVEAAEEELRAAEAEELRAKEALRSVTTEVAPAKQAAEAATQPHPADSDLLARMVAAVTHLDTTFGTAEAGSAKAELLVVQQEAQAAVQANALRQQQQSQQPQQPQQQPQRAKQETTEAKGAEEATAQPMELSEDAKAAESARLAKQRSEQAATRAHDLMQALEADQDPESKRARLAEALNQAWGDMPFMATQKA